MGVLTKLRLEEEEGTLEGVNRETLPTPPEERTWGRASFIAVWAGPSFDINQWNIGSSFINVGLTVTQCTPPVIVGSLFAALAITLMGSPGAKYHIGFPSLLRTTFGVGAKWVVLLRGLVGVIWYGVEALYVGYMVKIMLRCMFGHKWSEWVPVLGASAGGASAQLILSFFIAWILMFPLVWVKPRQLAIWFNARSIIGPIVYLALFGWIVHLGLTKPNASFPGFSIIQPNSLTSSSAKAWAFLSGVNSVVASIAPQVSNVSDITRYARRPSAAGWPQGVAFFLTKVVSVFLGVIATSFLTFRYDLPAPLWNLWDQLDLLLDQNWNGATRFGVFILALGFGFSSTMTNTYANTVPFAADVSSLFPKWLSFTRGQILIACLAPACVPWMLFTSGVKFLTFLGSYTFFMASVVGPIFVDYYIIRRGNYHVPSLYNRAKDSIYCFNSPVKNNWRGAAAFAGGIAMILPGLIEAYMPSKVGSPASRMYSSGWIISLTVSALLYYLFNLLSPVPILPPGNEALARSLGWGEMAETHGHLLSSANGEDVPDYARGEVMYPSRAGGGVMQEEEDDASEKKA